MNAELSGGVKITGADGRVVELTIAEAHELINRLRGLLGWYLSPQEVCPTPYYPPTTTPPFVYPVVTYQGFAVSSQSPVEKEDSK